MAGTPTTNYSIPTYADTDAPDLSGAYNDAMGIIDTQLKANADATAAKQDKLTAGTGIEIQGNEISATATGGKEYTAGAGIEISGGAITNKQASNINDSNIADVEENGITAAYRGGVPAIVTDPDTVDRVIAVNDSGHSYPGGSVPSVAVLKSYVESKMAAAGAAYTGTAPIVVDNGTHTISVNGSSRVSWENLTDVNSRKGVVAIYTADWANIPNGRVFNQVQTYTEDDVQYMDKVALSLSATESLVNGVKNYVDAATPDASTSAKGLVQLAAAYSGANTTQAATGGTIAEALSLFLNDWADIANAATTPLTTEMLANLYVTPSGMVVYKAPSE